MYYASKTKLPTVAVIFICVAAICAVFYYWISNDNRYRKSFARIVSAYPNVEFVNFFLFEEKSRAIITTNNGNVFEFKYIYKNEGKMPKKLVLLNLNDKFISCFFDKEQRNPVGLDFIKHRKAFPYFPYILNLQDVFDNEIKLIDEINKVFPIQKSQKMNSRSEEIIVYPYCIRKVRNK